MFRIAIVDDSADDRRRIEQLVLTQGERVGCAVTCALFSGTFDVSETAFDAYLLDISMPNENGIQLAGRIRSIGNSCPLIFVSSVDGMVFEAIHAQPLRFVRKHRLEQELPEALDAMFALLKESKKSTLLVEMSDETLLLPTSKILYVESFNKEQLIVMPERTVSCHLTMEKLEKSLVPLGFMRIHRCYLINVKAVFCVRQLIVTMDNGTNLPVSKPRLRTLKEAMKKVMMK